MLHLAKDGEELVDFFKPLFTTLLAVNAEADFEILTFDEAVGTALTVQKLNVDENAQILDATIGIATIGFSSIGIATVGVATIGVLTATEAVIGDLLITGNLTGSSGDAIIIDVKYSKKKLTKT